MTPTPPPSPESWRNLFNALSALRDTPGFQIGTHVEVLGRDLGDWGWVGWVEGTEEHLHGWRHPSGAWMLMAISIRVVMPTAPVSQASTSQPKTSTWTETSFEALAEQLLDGTKNPAGGPGIRALWAGRLRGLVSLAVTENEQALGMVYALRSA